jgi:hypothetical protein
MSSAKLHLSAELHLSMHSFPPERNIILTRSATLPTSSYWWVAGTLHSLNQIVAPCTQDGVWPPLVHHGTCGDFPRTASAHCAYMLAIIYLRMWHYLQQVFSGSTDAKQRNLHHDLEFVFTTICIEA